MELDGLDFMHRPGVDGAVVDGVQPTATVGGAAAGGSRILESVQEARVTIREAATDEQVVDPVAARAASKLQADEVHKMSAEEWAITRAQYWQDRFEGLAARRFGTTAG